jgi:hypothetical protein
MPQSLAYLTLSKQGKVGVYGRLFFELGKLVQIHLLNYWNRPIRIFGQLVNRSAVLGRDPDRYN